MEQADRTVFDRTVFDRKQLEFARTTVLAVDRSET